METATYYRKISRTIKIKGLNVKVNDASVSFTHENNNKRAALKNTSLEVSHPTKTLHKKIRYFSAELIERCHLGQMRAVIPGVADVIDLEKILKKYFA